MSRSGRSSIEVVGSTLTLVGADGSQERVLLTSDPMFDLRWAPDGSALAVSQQWRDDENGDPQGALVLVDPVTGAERGVSGYDGADFRWSPDSQQILTTSDHEIAVVDVATRAAKPIRVADEIGHVTFAAGVWSPGGTRIAYTSLHSSSDGPYTADVWTMSADGSDRHRVTHSPGLEGALAWAP